MPLTEFVKLGAVVFASLGVCGLFASVFFKSLGLRTLIFKGGTLGLTLGGLFIMLASALGALDSKALFGGLLLVLFGTGSSLLPPKTSRPPPSDELAH